MKSITEINQLGYLIQSVWQASYEDWYVYFRSPFEWHTWQAHGKTFTEAAEKAASVARQRGPAIEARSHPKTNRKRIKI